MSQTPSEPHRTRRSGTAPGVAIDLLVVAEDASDSTGKPNLARGLSIKLSPPENEDEFDSMAPDTPAFYQSTSMASVASFESERRGSGLLDTDIPIPSQEDRLADISDASKTLGTMLPLHRTESRLPSLEDMLNDEKLRTSLYEDAKSVILDELTSALTKKDSKEKFKKLSEAARRASVDPTFSMSRLSAKQKQAVIDTAVLFVKQQLAKCVEYWRAMVDAREGGMSQAEFDHRVAHPDFEFGARPWAFISIGLKLLRNFCVNKEVQQLIESHNLADAILLRHRLLFSVVASSNDAIQTAPPPLRPYHEEVANVLPRSVFTFLSNLMANNDELRLKLWPLMWPSVYWCFLILAGERFFDNFCLLLHNHLTPLLGAQTSDHESPTDLEQVSTTPSVVQLKNDLQLLCATEEELAVRRANGDSEAIDLGSEFADFMMALFSIVWRRHNRQAQTGGHHKGRLASVQGRAAQAGAVAEDWFALLLLRLLSQGQGHALKMLVECVLKRGVHNAACTGGAENWLQKCGVPSEVAQYINACPTFSSSLQTEGPVSGVDLAGLLIYSAAEYASVPDERKALQDHREGESADDRREALKQRNAQKLGRRWNMVRRSFLTTSIVNFMVALYCESVQSLANVLGNNDEQAAWCYTKRLMEKLPPQQPDHLDLQPPKDCSLGHGLHLLIRPLTKCLISLAGAPELAGRWADAAAEMTWNLTRALLFDIAPLLQEYLSSKAQNETPYVTLLNYVSPRDQLLLLSSLIDMNPDFQEECDEAYMKVVMGYQVFQTLDVGCEQAAILTLRIITKDHADNQRKLDQIRQSATEGVNTVNRETDMG